MKKYIGVDLGGTNVRVGVVQADGTIVAEYKRPSNGQAGPELVVSQIIQMIEQLPNIEGCQGIGIGVPGPVDTVKGVMTMSSNLKGFTNYPIVDKIQAYFKMPTFMDNDANVAGLAEAVLGAGVGCPTVYYITHSTGIGGAFIINGHVVSGSHGYAGEIGNIVVKRNGEKVNHLNAGSAETEASGTALIRKARQQIAADISDAKQVFELAHDGNNVAQKIIDDMAYDFALMMSSIALVTDPHCFVIGGGVTASHSEYFDKVEKYFYQLIHQEMGDVKILLAKLQEPGLLGAAMLPKSFNI